MSRMFRLPDLSTFAKLQAKISQSPPGVAPIREDGGAKASGLLLPTSAQSPSPDRGPSKYGNIKTGGEDSKRQAKRLSQLRLMNEAGQIRGLARQVEYVLLPKQAGERKLAYVADFQYEEWTSTGWVRVVEDSKGFRTRDYIIKRKLMLHRHGIVLRET